MKRFLIAFFLVAAMAAAAGIDGRWTATVAAGGKGPKGAKAGKKGRAGNTGEVIFNLKTDDGKLTGSVLASGGKRARSTPIQDGKLDGDSFTFTTVQSGKKGEQKWTWRGTLSGDQITGTRTREGARRGQSFTAKRQG